jgi:Zn finger protein HypA/HybF involved in hydrogenase expression
MHELSVIMAVVDTVDEYLKARSGETPGENSAENSTESGTGNDAGNSAEKDAGNSAGDGTGNAAVVEPAETPREDPGAAVKITRITLQIGKQSSYLPSCIREIWPFAVNETSLNDAALDIEELPGKGFLIKEIEIED